MVDSGICSVTASQSQPDSRSADSGCSTVLSPTAVTNTGIPEEEASVTTASDGQGSEDDSTRHSDNNTWISCQVNLVIQIHLLINLFLLVCLTDVFFVIRERAPRISLSPA